MSFFDREKLLKVALSRGYYNNRAVTDALAQLFDMNKRTVKNKLDTGRLTKEECELIGSFFEMTMREYYDVFMYGLFQPNSVGRYVCHIENMKEHIHPPEPEKPKEKKKRTKGKPGRKSNVQRILDEIDELDV